MRFLLSLFMVGAIAWSSALAWFLHAMPTATLPASQKSEVIIVLTGGSARVERGLEMLAAQAAPVLLISGVGEHVTQAEMMHAHASDALRDQIEAARGEIVLDHVARSTVSNADQSAAFIAQRGIKRIRLITANYHMLRSLHEFRMANPTVEILADPVFPQGFRRNEWWEHENTRRLVFSEFYKYFAVQLRDWMQPSHL